jgi:uncharacterized alkaline shock family protein YloU
MKILNAIFKALVSISLLCIGVILLLEVLNIEPRPLAFIATYKSIRLALGCSMIILVLLLWLTAIEARKRGAFISFDNENGTVSVSVEAISNLLCKLAKEFKEIETMDADIPARVDGKIEVNVWLRIFAGCRVQELAAFMQQRVKETLKEALGIVDIASVTVTIKEIINREPDDKEKPPPADDDDSKVSLASWQMQSF